MHDHGNCERCDAQEELIARLRAAGQEAVLLRERAIEQEHALRVAAEQRVRALEAALGAAMSAMNITGCESAMSTQPGTTPPCGHMDCIAVAHALQLARAALAPPS